ncbi:MAG: multicopper oxidase domain-containing protein [Acidimicrobiia bacterium]|jgi:FtsP/CotA-like multicopper oxidase with cupredoxin domain
MSEPEGTDGGLSRRDLLKKAGLGGAALLGGSLLGASVRDQAEASDGVDVYGSHDSHMAVGEDVLDTVYGGAFGPPRGLAASALDAHTFPPEPDGGPAGAVREMEVWVEERLTEVGHDVLVEAWTYNGTVPGPIIRATEGDTLRVHFVNRTGHAHSLHFHGAHRPEMDGWEPIPSGGETVYEIEAGPAGVHPYHCHTMPLAEHIARGLYGMMIVDPPGGRAPAQEVALLLSGFSNEDIGRNGIVAWNGVAGFYDRFPIKVKRSEPIRAYVVNMLEYESLGSFHLHARTFDVYPAGMGEGPAFRDDTIALAQGQRAMIEFTLPDYGRYMFHPHQHWLAERGAMGWFAAI